MPSAETNSVVRMSAPFDLQIRRKTVFVTPAIGARNNGKFSHIRSGCSIEDRIAQGIFPRIESKLAPGRADW
jgi:hypothetical protein